MWPFIYMPSTIFATFASVLRERSYLERSRAWQIVIDFYIYNSASHASFLQNYRAGATKLIRDISTAHVILLVTKRRRPLAQKFRTVTASGGWKILLLLVSPLLVMTLEIYVKFSSSMAGHDVWCMLTIVKRRRRRQHGGCGAATPRSCSCFLLFDPFLSLSESSPRT